MTITQGKSYSILWCSKSLLNTINGDFIYSASIYNLEYYIWSIGKGVRGEWGCGSSAVFHFSSPLFHFSSTFFFPFPFSNPQSASIPSEKVVNFRQLCVRFFYRIVSYISHRCVICCRYSGCPMFVKLENYSG